MTGTGTAGIVTARMELSAYTMLWIILITILLCGMAYLWCAGLQVDFGSTLPLVEPVILFLLIAWMFYFVGQAFCNLWIIRRVALTFQDFFFSAAQMMTALAVSGLLIYLAAHVGAVFPMRDDLLEYSDFLLGYDWRFISHWLYSHPILDKILLQVYDLLNLQIVCIIFLISIIFPGQRNNEFMALFIISIFITSIIFMFVPVFGMFGKADTATFDRLMDIRAGASIMTYKCTASLINFPSYHTILAILIPYSARHQCWSLIPTLLVNVVMLAATSPEGGHYLVDMLAGAAVAAVSIFAVRRCLPSYEAQQGHDEPITRFKKRVDIVWLLQQRPSGKHV